MLRHIASVFALGFCIQVQAAISEDSLKIGYCEFLYMYVAQVYQLQNNEGAAKAYVRRSAMMTVANLMLNEERGSISGDKMRQWSAAPRADKPLWDNNHSIALAEIPKCDRGVMPIALKVRDSRKTLWNRSYDELLDQLFLKGMEKIGLR